MRTAHAVCSVVCLALSSLALAQKPTPLAQLQAEALAHNPGLLARRSAWHAAQEAIAPAGALPDPQVEVQQMSVHIPAPFTGLNANMMSYVGIGAMQTIPFPGKRKLRAAVASSQAQQSEQSWLAAQRQLCAQVATAYLDLTAARSLRAVLTRQQQALSQVEKLAELHYRTAAGTQADVLAAQLQQTELLRDLAANKELQASTQAQLRNLLNRAPASPPIVPVALHPTRLAVPAAQLQAALNRSDPVLAVQRTASQSAVRSVALARKNFDPDFTVSYMYEHTASGFPDRYMASLTVTLPFFHRSSRQQPELEQAIALQATARNQFAALAQQERFRLTQALLEAQSDARILTIDQQGALPQARAAAGSALTAYASGKADLNSYLTAWREQLALEQQYWHTLASHERALVTVTEITGVQHD